MSPSDIHRESADSADDRYPRTPDGRYFVVRGRLWRCTNPHIPEAERAPWVKRLMQARREVGQYRRAGDPAGLARARQAVDDAKVALGERGPVWWTDDAPDYNRHLAKNTPYAEWFSSLSVSASVPPQNKGVCQNCATFPPIEMSGN